jgi:hypothetical protein
MEKGALMKGAREVIEENRKRTEAAHERGNTETVLGAMWQIILLMVLASVTIGVFTVPFISIPLLLLITVIYVLVRLARR